MVKTLHTILRSLSLKLKGVGELFGGIVSKGVQLLVQILKETYKRSIFLTAYKFQA